MRESGFSCWGPCVMIARGTTTCELQDILESRPPPPHPRNLSFFFNLFRAKSGLGLPRWLSS